jgi:hypothetical protein
MMKAILLLLLCGCASARAAAASNPDDPSLAFKDGDSTLVKESLDQKKIHALYNNGDFEPVLQVLEAFMKHNKRYSHDDSVFIAKHLAVVYTSNPATREKGRYFMYRLLELLPSAKLVDMYVSEEVDRIFDKVREEFMVRQHGMGVDTSAIVLPPKPDHGKNPALASEGHGGKWILWSLLAGGGAALVGGYFLYENVQAEEPPGAGPVPVKVITPRN